MCAVVPYEAIAIEEILDLHGNPVKIPPGQSALHGCGTCVAACPSKSIDLAGFTEEEVYAAIESLLS